MIQVSSTDFVICNQSVFILEIRHNKITTEWHISNTFILLLELLVTSCLAVLSSNAKLWEEKILTGDENKHWGKLSLISGLQVLILR